MGLSSLWRGVRCFIVFWVVLVAPLGFAVAEKTGIESTHAEHTRAVALARQGAYDEGLGILRRLLNRFPDDYPLQRDFIIISTWKGDCEGALHRYGRVRASPQLDAYLVGPVAECAVLRARTGDYDAAIDILTSLLPHALDDYPLRRDIALVMSWKGDCKGALAWFDPIRDDARHRPYLIVPVTDCLLSEHRPTEALALVEAGRAHYPGDLALQHAHTKVLVALRIEENLVDDRPAVQASLVSDKSDQGIREWFARVEASTRVAERARVYARYLISRADDAELDPGDMNRAGIGLRLQPSARLFLQQEFSTDTSKPNLGGSHTLLEYKPYDAWTLALAHDTYAEDISARARAADIEASHSAGGIEYNSQDYIWHWRATTNRYEFSDTNRRTSFFTTVGYAYEMLPEREQRIYVEWYQSRNTLEGTPYFNPKSDQSVGLVQKTDFVFDTRFKRHVDHLYFTLSAYEQEGFGTHTKWGVKYEQDYEFDESHSLIFGVAYNRNVYDGNREDEIRFEILYNKRF